MAATPTIGALERDLAEHGLRPAYGLAGEERLLVDEASRAIVRAAVPDPADTMSVKRVDLAESGTDVRDILAACQSMGLFAAKTCVVVRAAESLDKGKQAAKDLLRYLEAPNPDATLVLVASKFDGRGALAKALKKAKGLHTFDGLKARDVPAWVQGEARRLGHPLDYGTARLIQELVGTNLQQLRLVLDQLSLYVGPGRPIDEATAQTMLASTRVHSVFELVDAVGERRPDRALVHLGSMLANREQPLRILGMLIRHFRLLSQVQEARGQGAGPDDVRAALKLHPFQAKKLHAQASKFDSRTLRRAYERLYVTDLKLKSKGLAAPLVLERLVLDLCIGR